jgi:hypothetical protein
MPVDTGRSAFSTVAEFKFSGVTFFIILKIAGL